MTASEQLDTTLSSAARVADLEQRLVLLENELMRAQRLSSVGALASSITHEFNNILTTVINYARMGLRHTDEATRTKSFDRILSAGQRAAKITTGMLAYARQTTDRIEPADLKRLLDDVLVLVQKDLQSHRIVADIQAPASVWAMANASQIQQLMMNLIVNARQAMGESGRLKLIVRDNPVMAGPKSSSVIPAVESRTTSCRTSSSRSTPPRSLMLVVRVAQVSVSRCA